MSRETAIEPARVPISCRPSKSGAFAQIRLTARDQWASDTEGTRAVDLPAPTPTTRESRLHGDARRPHRSAKRHASRHHDKRERQEQNEAAHDLTSFRASARKRDETARSNHLQSLRFFGDRPELAAGPG
jgi:hypothetical protein